MKVYVVLELAIFGPVRITGVYADEIAALRAANESTWRKVQAHEVTGMAAAEPA